MKTVAVMDLGTNSIRLAVVRTGQDHGVQTLALQKEVVRLGEGEFAHHMITPSAMDRGMIVLKQFADIARSYGASEIVAVATAAVREAQNRAEFLKRARDEAGVDLKVISGLEEARLIYLGISSGADMDSHKGLFVDIGGGTTEIVVGDASDIFYLESLKLGAIRLTDVFLAHETGPISKKKYANITDYIRGSASNAFRHVRDQGFDIAFGSSGTIMNLAEITARRVEPSLSSIRNYALSYSDLVETIQRLCELSVEERRSVPGINPERADIIVGGAAILDSVMSGVGADSVRISDRALREGLIIDHVFREDAAKKHYMGTSVRERSVMEMGHACRFEQAHAEKVAELSCLLMLQLQAAGKVGKGKNVLELTRYAALLHDVGTCVSYQDHHRHSQYLIRNYSLLGFDDEEIEIIATAALCHRKLSPKKAAPRTISRDSQRLVEAIAAVLRIADALDRSQLGLTKEAVLKSESNGKKTKLEVNCPEECPLEMWSVESKKDLFEQVFSTELSVSCVSGAGHDESG